MLPINFGGNAVNQDVVPLCQRPGLKCLAGY
jgi:hypothetical protein